MYPFKRKKITINTATLYFDEGSSLNAMTHPTRKNTCSSIQGYYQPSH